MKLKVVFEKFASHRCAFAAKKIYTNVITGNET